MNDDIETLLRTLPLRSPPASLKRRVLGHRRRNLSVGIGVAVLSAAAAAVVIGVLWTGGFDADIAPREADPYSLRIEQQWQTVADDGVVLLEDLGPHRRFRHVTWRRTAWVDEENDIMLEAIVPEERIVLVSVPLQ